MTTRHFFQFSTFKFCLLSDHIVFNTKNDLSMSTGTIGVYLNTAIVFGSVPVQTLFSSLRTFPMSFNCWKSRLSARTRSHSARTIRPATLLELLEFSVERRPRHPGYFLVLYFSLQDTWSHLVMQNSWQQWKPSHFAQCSSTSTFHNAYRRCIIFTKIFNNIQYLGKVAGVI